MDEAGLVAMDRKAYVNLATFRRSGAAVETPVWFARAGTKLYVFTEARSGKVKRLRNDSRIRIAPCNARGKTLGEWSDGSGRRVDESSVVDAAYAALLRKYGWQMRLVNFFSRLTGRIEGRAILELEV